MSDWEKKKLDRKNCRTKRGTTYLKNAEDTSLISEQVLKPFKGRGETKDSVEMKTAQQQHNRYALPTLRVRLADDNLEQYDDGLELNYIPRESVGWSKTLTNI